MILHFLPFYFPITDKFENREMVHLIYILKLEKSQKRLAMLFEERGTASQTSEQFLTDQL